MLDNDLWRRLPRSAHQGLDNSVTSDTGSCTVEAKQAGNEDYEPASEVEQSFTIAKGSETIAFNPPASVSYGTAPFILIASASSGLAVTFSGSGPCTVTTAGEVTITGVGSCTVTASQGIAC